jgi:hypothetical protein
MRHQLACTCIAVLVQHDEAEVVHDVFAWSEGLRRK